MTGAGALFIQRKAPGPPSLQLRQRGQDFKNMVYTWFT